MAKKCKYYREDLTLMYTPGCVADETIHEEDIHGDYCPFCGGKIKYKEFTKHPKSVEEEETKACPTCGTSMNLRDGKYGKFWYCPAQHNCGQKTISYSSIKYIESDLEEQQVWVDAEAAGYVDKDSCHVEKLLRSQGGLAGGMISLYEATREAHPLIDPMFPGHDYVFDPECDDPIHDNGDDWRPW